MKWLTRWYRRDVPVLILFGLLAIPFLSPIASNKLWPSHDATDLYTYLQLVDQARRGVEEGQFPLRVAPERYEGWRFPLFQWYAPLSYYLAGTVQKFISPNNPYIAFKIMLWLALTVAGYGGFKLGRYVSRSTGAGLVAGAVSLTAPFLLVDMHIRFQMQECLGTGLLALVAYWTLRAFASRRWRYVCVAGLAWGVLIQIYSLAFLFGSLFIGAWIAMIGTWNFRAPRFMRMVRAGVAYASGIFFSCWYILPYTRIGAFFELELPKNSVTPLSYEQDSPLSVLLSPVPIPLVEPGANMYFCYRLGWPLVLSMGLLTWVWLRRSGTSVISTKLMRASLVLALVMTLLAWSPIHEFWKFVPATLLKIQFPFRFLVQSVWLGAILSALAIRYLCPKGVRAPVVAGLIFVVGITGGLTLPTNNIWNPDNKVRIEPVYKTLGMTYNGEFNHGRSKGPSVDYELYGHLVMNRYLYATQGLYGNIDSPVLQDFFGWLVTDPVPNLSTYVLPTVNQRLEDFGRKRGWLIDEFVDLPVPASGMPEAVQVIGMIPFGGASSNPIGISMLVNGSVVSRQEVVPNQGAKLIFPLPKLGTPANQFNLEFKAEAGAMIERPNEIADNMGRRSRLFYVESLQFLGLAPEQNVLPAQTVQKMSRVEGDTVICNIHVTAETGIVQLPAMYYPGLLDVRVNSKKTDYFPTFQRPFHWMASIRLPPGDHRVSVRFVGDRLGNAVSWIATIGLLAGLVVVEARRTRGRKSPNPVPEPAKPRKRGSS